MRVGFVLNFRRMGLLISKLYYIFYVTDCDFMRMLVRCNESLLLNCIRNWNISLVCTVYNKTLSRNEWKVILKIRSHSVQLQSLKRCVHITDRYTRIPLHYITFVTLISTV